MSVCIDGDGHRRLSPSGRASRTALGTAGNLVSRQHLEQLFAPLGAQAE
jgi:hypothetical protein